MTRRVAVEVAVAVGVAAGLVGGVAWWGAAPPAGAARGFAVQRPAAAAPAPEVTLADLDGRAVRLGDLLGRVVLVNLWASWCEPCREEMPALARLARDLGPRGLAVVAVNHQESRERALAFVRETGLTLPVLLDPGGLVAARYRTVGLPATYVLDRQGRLVGTVVGYRDWAGAPARAYLHEVLAAS
jgi:thiol-disulfide isomerase/thioredoxin